MKRYIFTFTFFLISYAWQAVAQTVILTDSNLPIVIINTDGYAPIVDNPRVMATMKIIDRGPGIRNYVTDQNIPQYLNYNGRIDIEIRGSSSQWSPENDKKQYGFTTRKADNITNNNVSLLEMPLENDWILNSMVFDPARIRDYLCYNLSRQIGEYASRTAYCEVIINGNYKGLFLLQEKIKADENRVNVLGISTTDNYSPEVSGGYITKADKITGGDPVAWTMSQWNGGAVNYIHDLPRPENATVNQTAYIEGQFNNLANDAFSHNTSLLDGIPADIDIPSFIDQMIISEISSNADAYRFSTFFHKDRNGKLRAGPIWDNDLTYGNDLFFWGYDRSKTDIWQFSDGENDGSRFWRDMYYTDKFKCYLSKRWNELTVAEQPLNLNTIDNFIDQTVTYINDAVKRDSARWNVTENFNSQIAGIKTWLASRIPWITSNLGSYSACSNVYIPSLVITKINYHPEVLNEFPSNNDLEFIEIANTGTVAVDLTGIYFAGTGLVYQFPLSSVLLPASSVFLAGNTQAFKIKYGFSPFGKFTRDLSNRDQNIILSDGWGNIIDNVHYFNTLPWPDADGNGYYLKLTDTSLDNSLAASWTASNVDDIIIQDTLHGNEFLKIYPNPVDDFLEITAGAPIGRLQVFDIPGRLLISENLSSKTYRLNVSHFPRGTYIVKITSAEKSYTRGIVKR